MKKTTKLYIIIYLIYFITITVMVLYMYVDSDYNVWIAISILALGVIPTIIIENKIKKIKNEESKTSKDNRLNEAINKLYELKDINDTYYLMYMLITNQCIELNPLLDKANLEIDCFYDKADNILELSIDSKYYSKSFNYSTVIYIDNNQVFLVLNNSDEQVVTNKSYSELIELIQNDINLYYKSIDENGLLYKLKMKEKKNNKA